MPPRSGSRSASATPRIANTSRSSGSCSLLGRGRRIGFRVPIAAPATTSPIAASQTTSADRSAPLRSTSRIVASDAAKPAARRAAAAIPRRPPSRQASSRGFGAAGTDSGAARSIRTIPPTAASEATPKRIRPWSTAPADVSSRWARKASPTAPRHKADPVAAMTVLLPAGGLRRSGAHARGICATLAAARTALILARSLRLSRARSPVRSLPNSHSVRRRCRC